MAARETPELPVDLPLRQRCRCELALARPFQTQRHALVPDLFQVESGVGLYRRQRHGAHPVAAEIGVSDVHECLHASFEKSGDVDLRGRGAV